MAKPTKAYPLDSWVNASNNAAEHWSTETVIGSIEHETVILSIKHAHAP